MAKRKNKGRMPIVSGQHPAVVFLDQHILEGRLVARKVSEKAGLGPGAISNWRTLGTSPSVGNLEAALNVVGYKLAVVPL